MFDEPESRNGCKSQLEFRYAYFTSSLGAVPAEGGYYPHHLKNPSHQDCPSVSRYMTQLAKQSSQISVFEPSGDKNFPERDFSIRLTSSVVRTDDAGFRLLTNRG